MNYEEKKRIRMIALVLLGLSAISLFFVGWNYKSSLEHDETVAFQQIEGIAKFLASQIPENDYQIVASSLSKGGVRSDWKKQETAAGETLRDAANRMADGLPSEVNLRLLTKYTLSTYDERLFIDLLEGGKEEGKGFRTVPHLLWDRYAAVDPLRFRSEGEGDTLFVYAPVMDGDHRVIGHILTERNFRPHLAAARHRMVISSGLFMAVLFGMLALVGYFTLQLMRSHLRERVDEQERRTSAAERDPLTGLYNRSYVMDRVGVQLKGCRATGGSFAIMMLDLDNFKKINAIHGPHAGDDLIKLVARRIRNILSKDNVVGRAGGDEFIVLMPNVKDKQFASSTAERIVKVLGTPFLIDQQQVELSVSIGICFYPEDGNDVGTLLRSASTALNHAKMSGKNGHQLFDAQMSRLAVERLRMEKDLQRALERQELRLWYQPKFSLDKELVGMEALLRWHAPDGIVPPDRFITAAEASGQIIPIGEWVIDEATRQLAAWHLMGYRALRMSVNISPVQFNDDQLVPKIKAILTQHAVTPSDLEVEITESTLMERVDIATRELQELSSYGVKIAIDDFGTGYSAIARLGDFPIDVLKVDKSFIDELPDNIQAIGATNTVLGLAKIHKMSVVAEGVENEKQLEYLREHGCDIIQGYLFGKPMPADDFTDKFLQFAVKS